MVVSIHQPEFFPWIPFFDKIDLSDQFVLLDNVQFEKNYFQNRFKMRDGKGGFQLVTLPVESGEHSELIFEKKIDQKNSRLTGKLLKNIQYAYSRSDYFNLYYNDFAKIIQSSNKLSDINVSIIKYICNKLAINTKIHLASEMNDNLSLKSSELLLSLCKKLNSTVYISGKMGFHYLDENIFLENNIKIFYHSYNFIEYKQSLETTFIPYLSIIDLLFNHGENSLDIIRKGRELKIEQ
ncbi:MAG: WbqC family protein [Nanoarchaeota archaeon]|nr:WbqC family protein [Nanoarchaeota archaeon]